MAFFKKRGGQANAANVQITEVSGVWVCTVGPVKAIQALIAHM